MNPKTDPRTLATASASSVSERKALTLQSIDLNPKSTSNPLQSWSSPSHPTLLPPPPQAQKNPPTEAVEARMSAIPHTRTQRRVSANDLLDNASSNKERTKRKGRDQLTSSPPFTASNPFFLISSLSGRIAASRHNSLRSEPDRPSVRAARWGMEREGARVVLESICTSETKRKRL